MADGLSTAQFRRRLKSVAAGSNEGDAGRAADCFAEHAVFIEPPDCEFVGESLF